MQDVAEWLRTFIKEIPVRFVPWASHIGLQNRALSLALKRNSACRLETVERF